MNNKPPINDNDFVLDVTINNDRNHHIRPNNVNILG